MEMEVPAEPSPRHEKAVRAAGARRSALGSGLYDIILLQGLAQPDLEASGFGFCIRVDFEKIKKKTMKKFK